jgi:hypothetical protein
MVDQGERRFAARRAEQLVGEQLGRDVLEVGPSELPTVWALSKPASSIARSTASASTASLICPSMGGPPASTPAGARSLRGEMG